MSSTTSIIPTPIAPTTPTGSSTQSDLLSGAANLNEASSTFLTLLTTQLKNQDPTSPLDTNQFTAQLVQMTGVQQQLLSNQLLQQLVSQSGAGQGAAGAIGLIGKTVTAASGDATLSGGKVGWGYSLNGVAASATLTVSDSTGKTVWSGAAPDLSKGAHAFDWNGRTSSGVQLPDGGIYTLKVAAVDAKGAAVTASPQITGVAGGVQTIAGRTVVQIGSSQAPLSSITGVAAAS